MKDINDICFIIPARVNSKRVLQKMTREFGDTCLFENAINILINTKNIPNKNIYLAIGDKELIDIAKKYENKDVNIFYRTENSINTDGFLINCEQTTKWFDQQSKKFKYFMILNACQPFIKPMSIEKFINHFLNSNSKSFISVIESRDYYWDENKELNINNFKTEHFNTFIFNTKYVKKTYKASHTLQIGLLDDIKNKIWLGTFKKNDPELFILNEDECFDIDYPWEFEMANIKYKFINNI